MLLFQYVHLSLDTNKRIWSLEFLEVFSCKPHSQFLTMSPNRENYLLDKPIWKCKAPLKIKHFVWILNKINANDMLQKYMPFTALSPNMCCVV